MSYSYPYFRVILIFKRFSVSRIANELIKPLVRTMDRKSHIDPSVISALFENGVSRKRLMRLNRFIVMSFFFFSLWQSKCLPNMVALMPRSSRL